MKKIFRLLLVSFALSACGTKPTIETTPTQKDVYTLNANNVTVEVGGTYQFHLYKNNVLVTRNVMWQVSTDLLDITSDGLLTGIYPTNSSSNAFVRGSIGKNYVDCKVTVTGRDSNIYRCMTTLMERATSGKKSMLGIMNSLGVIMKMVYSTELWVI